MARVSVWTTHTIGVSTFSTDPLTTGSPLAAGLLQASASSLQTTAPCIPWLSWLGASQRLPGHPLLFQTPWGIDVAPSLTPRGHTDLVAGHLPW